MEEAEMHHITAALLAIMTVTITWWALTQQTVIVW